MQLWRKASPDEDELNQQSERAAMMLMKEVEQGEAELEEGMGMDTAREEKVKCKEKVTNEEEEVGKQEEEQFEKQRTKREEEGVEGEQVRDEKQKRE